MEDNIKFEITTSKDKDSIIIYIFYERGGKNGRFYRYEFSSDYNVEKAILEVIASEFGYEPSQLFNFEGCNK